MRNNRGIKLRDTPSGPDWSLLAPSTEALWAGLSAQKLESISEVDARRLAVERERMAPRLRESHTEAIYSVRGMLRMWEMLVRKMESQWAPDGSYSISAYPNQLASRDHLDRALSEISEDSQNALVPLVTDLDARFRAETVPDEEGELTPWLKPPAEGPVSDRWRRKPRVTPW